MYQALYRKWRPDTFDKMSGQAHITDILKRQCESGKISHAYLFCGTRGTGKTSAAKILAKAANCLAPIDGNPCGACENCLAIASGTATDILEIDAASNNGVDNIRELRDEVMYPPAFLKKRVYIIDEVHMLSPGAFNALLKTLEEPPEYVIFILATTELYKIPATILSRCQRFEFRNISTEDIKNRLMYVSENEGIKLSENAALLIAGLAEGAMRDGLSLLESCAAANDGKEITVETVSTQLGIAGNELSLLIFESILKGDIKNAVDIIGHVNSSATDLTTFLEDMAYLIRDIILTKLGGSGSFNQRFVYSKENSVRLKKLADGFNSETLFRYADILDKARSSMTRLSVNKRLLAEMAVIRLCTPITGNDSSSQEKIESLEARISTLEKKMISSPPRVENSPKQERKEAAANKAPSSEKKGTVPDVPFADTLDFLFD